MQCNIVHILLLHTELFTIVTKDCRGLMQSSKTKLDFTGQEWNSSQVLFKDSNMTQEHYFSHEGKIKCLFLGLHYSIRVI